MKATEILRQEHIIIEGVLNALERAAQRLASGAEVLPAFFLDAAEFIRGFADDNHHRKEEGVLFEAMARNGFSRDTGPIAVMLAEHEQGRAFTRALREAAEKLQRGEKSAREEVIMNALAYVALLRQHIQKENNILFRMADTVIPQVEHAQIEAGFEKVERDEIASGAREKYAALAARLGEQFT